MTDKELHKLKKSDLIEILYYLSRENDELRDENEKLKAKYDALIEKTIGTISAQPDASCDNQTEEAVEI